MASWQAALEVFECLAVIPGKRVRAKESLDRRPPPQAISCPPGLHPDDGVQMQKFAGKGMKQIPPNESSVFVRCSCLNYLDRLTRLPFDAVFGPLQQYPGTVQYSTVHYLTYAANWSHSAWTYRRINDFSASPCASKYRTSSAVSIVRMTSYQLASLPHVHDPSSRDWPNDQMAVSGMAMVSSYVVVYCQTQYQLLGLASHSSNPRPWSSDVIQSGQVDEDAATSDLCTTSSQERGKGE